jgi:branched-chain amino acid transport system substrate-binding protein
VIITSLKKFLKIFIFISFTVILMFSCKMGKAKEVKIGAIFSITGPSFLGLPEANTAKMVVDKINSTGGVNGTKINLIIKDSGGSPEKALSFAKQLIEEEKVIAIIGPSTSGESLQIKNLCQESKTILLACAAAEKIVDPVASYVFTTPQEDKMAVKKIYETMKTLGINKIGVLSSNTGFGAGGKEQLAKYAKDYGIEIVISETYDKDAKDLTAVLTKINSKKVSAIVNWSIEDAQSIIPKNMKQLGIKTPLFQSHGFGNIKFVEVAGSAANGIIFPAGRLLIAEELPDNNPQKSLLINYKNDYENMYKEKVSTFGGHAYDAIMILVEGIKQAGTDKVKIRNAIENLKNFAGTAGIYNLSPSDHNGLSIDAFEMQTVKDGKFVIYKK